MQNIKEELEDDKNNQCFEAGDFNTPQLKSIEELYKDALLELQSKRHLAVENIKNMAFEEIKQDPSLWAAYVRGWEDRTADVHLNPSLITSPRTLRQSDEKTDEKTAGCKPDKPKLGPATTSSQTPEPAQRKKPLSTQQMTRKNKRDHARMEEFLAKKRAQESGPPPPTK
ncbi:uncharacterized protein LOC100572097 isoform X2 [Acyrthosiphon pisum]|nr:uncharacterized protein LOC100572097 isoform X2 [Acyrthosiphon pisum]|eukprot:XP_003245081.1 PREDICTED: uncharacterized protein LOC100572097 [Acyrthosiphon pisum]